jgi:hypothetical protein
MDYISIMHRYHIDWCKIATSKLNDDAKFRLLPLLLLLIVHTSFYLYKGKSNNKTQPSLTNDYSCTT